MAHPPVTLVCGLGRPLAVMVANGLRSRTVWESAWWKGRLVQTFGLALLVATFVGWFSSTLGSALLGIAIGVIPLVGLSVLLVGACSAVAWVVGKTTAARLSRARERAADRAAVRATGSPAALASALQRLEERITGSPTQDLREASAVSSLSILPIETGPEKVMLGAEGDVEPSFWWLRKLTHRVRRVLFGTHPSTESRVETLSELQRERSETGSRPSPSGDERRCRYYRSRPGESRMASTLVDVAVVAAVLVVGTVGARLVQRTAPVLSVGRVTRTVVLGTAAVGPFVLVDLGVLPVVSGGREVVTPLAIAVVLFLLAARLVGFWDTLEGPAAD